MKHKKNIQQDDDQKDLDEHGVKQITPENDEYYTLNLTRGDDTDGDDRMEMDIADKDPANNESDEPLKSSSYYEGQVVQNKKRYRPMSSNAGGPVNQNDIVDQDTVSGNIAGEPGGRIDEDTG